MLAPASGVLALVVLICAVHANEGDRLVAVTFDDLPATAAVAEDLGSVTRLTRNLLRSFRPM